MRVRIAAFALILSTIAFAQSAKRPLQHRDYDGWRTIQTQVLSRDGKFLAYSLFPEDGDGQLIVRNLATGKELRESAGSPPPAEDNTDFEAAAGPAGGAVRTIRIAFTHDNRFAIASAFPPKAETDAARKARKRADEMPRPGMIIVDLSTMTATRVADVASFQVPENGESFVAYLKGAKSSADSAPAAQNDDYAYSDLVYADQGRGGRGGQAAGGGRGNRNRYGSDLMVRDLRSNTAAERKIEDVLEFSIAKDAKALVYAVASKNEETNGVYGITPGTDATAATLVNGKGHYSKITWDSSQKELAFLSDRDDASSKPARYAVYFASRTTTGLSPATAIVSTSTPGFHAGWGIADRGQISFSRDGSRLFISAAPLESLAALDREAPQSAAPAAPVAGDEKVLADLWHYKDDFVQPMQKVRAAQERSRSYRGVYNIASKTFVQASDLTMQNLTPSDDGRMALGTDDREYRHMVDFDGTYNDVYFVDTATGTRRLALKQSRGGGGGGRGGANSPLSPDGRNLLAFKDKKWWSIQSSDGRMTDLSGKLPVAFYVEDHDTPDEAPSYGNAGWTKDSKWALIYDRFDVWAVAADGSSSRKLTNGRATNLQFRLQRLDAPDPEEDRGVDPTKPLLFRVENQESRESGFYSLTSFDKGEPQKLI